MCFVFMFYNVTNVMPIINSGESLSICYCLQIEYSLIINISFKCQHKRDISDVCLLVKDLRISCHLAMHEFNLLLRIISFES